MDIVLQLGKKSFKLAFGLGLFRLLGRKWDLEGIDDVVQKISTLNSNDGKLSFVQLDLLEELLLASIEYGGCADDLSGLKIMDEFFREPETLDKFLDALVEAMPRNEPEQDLGKQKAAKVPNRRRP